MLRAFKKETGVPIFVQNRERRCFGLAPDGVDGTLRESHSSVRQGTVESKGSTKSLGQSSGQAAGRKWLTPAEEYCLLHTDLDAGGTVSLSSSR